MTTLAATAERVTARANAVDYRRVLLALLFAPLFVLGWSARWAVRALVWLGAWVWFGLVEGWQAATPPRAEVT